MLVIVIVIISYILDTLLVLPRRIGVEAAMSFLSQEVRLVARELLESLAKMVEG